MSIITLTLNPAIDVHLTCDTFETGKENFGDVTQRISGGKGINISRALTKNGIPNKAVAILGEENSSDFLLGLSGTIDEIKPVILPGRIRENFTIHTKEGETRLSFKGFSVDKKLMKALQKLVGDMVSPGDFVTITGSLPSGITVNDVKPFIFALKEKGALVVIDSRSFTLSDLIDIKPWLIKPNGQEISQYLSKDIKTFDDILPEAKKLHEQGITNVMVSLGAEGALLVSDEGVFTARPPIIKAISTIGAGDSSIAGFMTADTSAERLKTAVAYGTAACLTEGTLPPEKSDVEKIIEKVICDF